jgi:NAD(P)-dependent dehydrogenase (short-subunit alcohol dehydrogenase family)
MRVVVIGGTGHVGSYVVPRLVEDGHDVICVSRGNSQPYTSGLPWDVVRMVTIEHLGRGPNHSMVKARTQLHYEPRYASLAAVEEALTGMVDRGHLLGHGANPGARADMSGV